MTSSSNIAAVHHVCSIEHWTRARTARSAHGHGVTAFLMGGIGAADSFSGRCARGGRFKFVSCFIVATRCSPHLYCSTVEASAEEDDDVKDCVCCWKKRKNLMLFSILVDPRDGVYAHLVFPDSAEYTDSSSSYPHGECNTRPQCGVPHISGML